MLQVRADAGGGQRGPHGVLVHGVAVFCPHGEVVGIQRELRLQAFYDVLVFKKQHRAGGGFEHRQLLRGLLELPGGHDGAQRVFGEPPQFFMLRAKQHHHAGGLRIERRGRVFDRVFDNGGHFARRQRQVFV